MTIRELIDLLYEVENKDQEIEIEDVIELMSLWERHKRIQNKISQLTSERTCQNFILGWIKEGRRNMRLIREYESE